MSRDELSCDEVSRDEVSWNQTEHAESRWIVLGGVYSPVGSRDLVVNSSTKSVRELVENSLHTADTTWVAASVCTGH